MSPTLDEGAARAPTNGPPSGGPTTRSRSTPTAGRRGAPRRAARTATTRPRAQQERVGEPDRHLLDVVGHQDADRGQRLGGESAQAATRSSRAAEVEPGRRLVEQQQLGVGHQGAGDLHPLALPLGQRPEDPVRQLRRAQLRQQAAGPGVVAGVVPLAPAAVMPYAGGAHDVERPARRLGCARRGRRCASPIRGRSSKTSTAPSRSPSTSTVPRVGWMQRRGDLAAGWSCRPRWGRAPTHRSPVVHRPVDAVEQDRRRRARP